MRFLAGKMLEPFNDDVFRSAFRRIGMSRLVNEGVSQRAIRQGGVVVGDWQVES